VLNDLYREATRLGVHVDGVRVSAVGGSAKTGARPGSTTPWSSTRRPIPAEWPSFSLSSTRSPRYPERYVPVPRCAGPA